MRFQKTPDDMHNNSFIWDVLNPNAPMGELRTNSPICSIQFFPKNGDIIAAGCYNGLLKVFDLRTGADACWTSEPSASHWEPVYDLSWIQGNIPEFATVSTDGHCHVWDYRESAPVDSCTLTNGEQGGSKGCKTFGGVSLEWMQEAGPTKYLV